MKIVLLKTAEEQARGLRGMNPIPMNTLFVFWGIAPGSRFTAAGVLEAFNIRFLDADYKVLSTWYIDPGNDFVEAPAGTVTAVESLPITKISKLDLQDIRNMIERGRA